MKSKLLFSAIIMAFISPQQLLADPIDVARAKQIAARFTTGNQQPEPVTGGVAAKRTTASGQAPLYIFDRGNEQGFVIISGDDCLPPVLGYTESGHYDPQLLPPTLNAWIESYGTMITTAQETGVNSYQQPLAAAGKEDVAPLVTAHWSQGAPYNNLCPMLSDGSGRSITGCVATAAAQVIYYWRNSCPRRTQYNTPTYGYGAAPVTESIPAGTPLMWELMLDRYSGSTPAKFNTAVATLMSVIGTSTWLTYGSSTSGQISNLVDPLNRQFFLSSVCHYKSGYTQSAWENMIYSDLSKGWPIVYCGVSESQGGHAVVVDGYRAADNLFHFNFGWGGSGDGYFTVNDVNGMNGFNGSQGMTHCIHPRECKLTATVQPISFSSRMSNEIVVRVTNNGGNDYKGIYFFASRATGAPSDITKANSSDLTTIIPSGDSAIVRFTYRPTLSAKHYIYITDNAANIIAHTTLDAVAQTPDLSLQSFTGLDMTNPVAETVEWDGSSRSISTTTLYHSTATLEAEVYNTYSATSCVPKVTCSLMSYDADTKTWAEVNSQSVNSETFMPNSLATLPFSFTDLQTGKLYAAVLNSTYTISSSSYVMDTAAADTTLFFRVSDSDLAVSVSEDGHTVKATGHWNATRFGELAPAAAYTCYDLEEVVGLSSLPASTNPYSLYFVQQDCTLEGSNIIKGGYCDDLRLAYGYDFVPKAGFKAHKVEFTFAPVSQKWTYLCLPFDCEVPDQMMARYIKRFIGTLVGDYDTPVLSMKAGVPYLVKSIDPETCNSIEAEDVLINTHTAPAPTDTICTTYVTLPSAANRRKLNNAAAQTFVTGSSIPAFSGYLEYEKEPDISIYELSDMDAALDELSTTLCTKVERLVQTGDIVLFTDEQAQQLDEGIVQLSDAYRSQVSVEEAQAAQAAFIELVDNLYKSLTPSQLKPLDLTEQYIANPSFETKRTTGWDIARTTGQLTKVLDNTVLANYCVGADGSYVFYSYSTTGAGCVTLSQQLTGLQPGYYQVSAMLSGNNGGSVTLFANNNECTITEDGFGLTYLSEAVTDEVLVEDGTLTIGVKSDDTGYRADNFRLYFVSALPSAAISQKADANEALLAVGGKGSITLRNLGEEPVAASIYATNGTLVRSLTVDTQTRLDGLGKGIYIVNHKKIIVH